MLDLTKAVLPESIEAEGRIWRIKTWFKYWLRFLQVCAGPEDERDFGFLFEDGIPTDKAEAMKALSDFARPESLVPRSTGGDGGGKVLDYSADAGYLYSAFVQQYGIDLVDGKDLDGNPLHWHKFLALCEGLHGTKMNDIMEARLYDETDKSSYEESRRKARDSWTLEGIETSRAEAAAVDAFNEAFS